jgi:SOS-response transcriptional repressor LexA
MIEDLIDDGDIVFLEPAQSADNGDRVAVWLKDRGEVTLKRFYHEGARVRLQPANSTMQPIYTSPDNVEIQGVDPRGGVSLRPRWGYRFDSSLWNHRSSRSAT